MKRGEDEIDDGDESSAEGGADEVALCDWNVNVKRVGGWGGAMKGAYAGCDG